MCPMCPNPQKHYIQCAQKNLNVPKKRRIMEELTDLKHQYQDKLESDYPGTPLWLTLFMIADRHSRELAHILEFLRNSGTVLEPNRRFGYILKPIVGENGWPSLADYDREKQALGPHLNLMIKILKELSNFGND